MLHEQYRQKLIYREGDHHLHTTLLENSVHQPCYNGSLRVTAPGRHWS